MIVYPVMILYKKRLARLIHTIWNDVDRVNIQKVWFDNKWLKYCLAHYPALAIKSSVRVRPRQDSGVQLYNTGLPVYN